MSSEWGLKQILTAVIIIIILGVFIFFLVKGTTDPIKIIKGWAFPVEELKYTTEEHNAYYNLIYRNYKNCKLSPAVSCYCDLGAEKIPDDVTLEISNANTQTTFRLWKEGVLYDMYSTTPVAPEGETIPVPIRTIENDQIFISTSTAGEVPVSELYLTRKARGLIVEKARAYSGLNLYTPTDLPGQNLIDFKNGVIYKQDQTKTVFKESAENLKKCRTDKLAISLYENIQKITDIINLCTKQETENNPTPCPSTLTLNIPEGYKIQITNSVIEATDKSNNKIIDSQKLSAKVCLTGPTKQNMGNQILLDSTIKGLNPYKFPDGSVCLIPLTQVQNPGEL